MSSMSEDVTSGSEEVHSKSEPNNINNAKVCSVCGDIALGYNFNALTCESCKAFFRRNALKSKEFKCPFSESCIMTAITRRFCQRCRLQKCFSVGMRKEYIMSEEERLNKRNKIEQNRARKRAVAQNFETHSEHESKSCRSSNKKSRLSSDWSTPAADWSVSTATESLGSPIQSSESLSERLLEPFPSPTTASSATCVPSPNSPPDSATVAASHNTEMIAKKDEALNKQSMISVITYPHQMNIASHPQHATSVETINCGVSSTSVSVQTSPVPFYSTLKSYKTVSTQTSQEIQQNAPKLSAPLLSSLINSHRSEEPICRRQEASTSPAFQSNISIKDDEGGWMGVDGVNGNTAVWDSCVPPSGVPVRDVSEDILADVLRMPIVPNSIESILSEAIKLEFSTYTPNSVPASHLHSQAFLHSKELNDAERAKLNELIVANKAMLAPLEETNLDNSLLDIINLTAVAIRRLVKMAKKINAFKNMCQEDQVGLLKGACMEMLILHSVTTYNPDKDSWALPSTSSRNISVDILKEATGNLYQEHRRFQQSFDPKWRTDENIMLILSAIVLFTPDRTRIVHRDVIKLEQNSYYYLLRRYLECTFSGCEARSTFLKLIQKVSELHCLNEEHVRALLDVDPSEVEPLLIEIFDLKPFSIT